MYSRWNASAERGEQFLQVPPDSIHDSYSCLNGILTSAMDASHMVKDIKNYEDTLGLRPSIGTR